MSQGLGIFGGGGGGGSSISATEPAQISELEEKTTPVAGDVYIIEDSEDNFSKKKVVQSNVSSAWTQVINESGASFSNWTSIGGGTWASNSGVIKQTDTAGSTRYGIFNTAYPVAGALLEAEIQMKTDGAVRRGGLVIGHDGSSTAHAVCYIDPGNNNIYLERAGAAVVGTYSTTIDINIWYKVRMLMFGNVASVWVDGVFKGSADSMRAQTNGSYFGLHTYAAEVWFRNVKAWVLTLPA